MAYDPNDEYKSVDVTSKEENTKRLGIIAVVVVVVLAVAGYLFYAHKQDAPVLSTQTVEQAAKDAASTTTDAASSAYNKAKDAVSGSDSAASAAQK